MELKSNNMKKESCIEEFKMNYTDFLKYIKKFKHIRVGVGGGTPPFQYTFFRANKKEVANIVLMNQYDVWFSVMKNTQIKDDVGVLYIDKLKMKIKLD